MFLLIEAEADEDNQLIIKLHVDDEFKQLVSNCQYQATEAQEALEAAVHLCLNVHNTAKYTLYEGQLNDQFYAFETEEEANAQLKYDDAERISSGALYLCCNQGDRIWFDVQTKHSCVNIESQMFDVNAEACEL